jgi:hypothetical protein
MSTPLTPAPRRLAPAPDGLFVLEGSMLDGSHAWIGPERLQIGFIEAVRIPWWQSARAIFAAAGLVGLAALGALAWALVRLVRRIRARVRGAA